MFSILDSSNDDDYYCATFGESNNGGYLSET